MGNLVGILFASSIVLMLVTPMLSVPVTADGYSVRYDTALDTWDSLAERDQFCIVNYQDGVEKMIVQIRLDGPEVRSSDKIAWLFPIPAAPESVSLKHFQTVPRFAGDSQGSVVLDKTADSLSWGYAFATQLYALPIVLLGGYVMVLGFGTSSGGADQVESYAVLDQYGVTSEVLHANSSEALSAYLTSKGLTLPEMAEGALDYYLGGDYSIVLSWISNVPSFLSKALKVPDTNDYSLGIGVEFPCDEIFFPLKMTSAYGELEIPITVQVLDYVTPDEYPSGGNLDFSCKYRVQDTYAPLIGGLWNYDYQLVSRINITEGREEFEYFFAEQIAAQGSVYLKGVDYTVVNFDGPAAELTEDLWLSDSPPLRVSSLKFVGDNPWLVTLAVVILVSCVSSLIACAVVLGWNARFMRTFILLGLFNVASIFGYYCAYMDLVKPRLKRENVDVEGKGLRLMAMFSALFIVQLASVYLCFFHGPTV